MKESHNDFLYLLLKDQTKANLTLQLVKMAAKKFNDRGSVANT